MWKCIGLLLFFGQWIVVTAESSETPGVLSPRNSECCPCPEARSDDLTPSASRHTFDSCPCNARSSDLASAASIYSPALSVVRPISRQVQQKEVKPLLDPEVGLVSSVLETLRAATEEEYQEALAKDAKNAKEDEINNPVTIVVNPEYRDADDGVPEASENQAVKCIHPFEEQDSVLRHNSFYYPRTGLPSISQKPILGKSHDMNEAASHYHRSLNTPRNVEVSNNYRYPLHNILKTPIYDNHHSNNLVQFTPEYEKTYLPVTSLLPRRRNNLLASHNQFPTKNILKEEVSTPMSKEILDEGYFSRETIRNSENDLDAELAENKLTKNCIVDGFAKNNNEKPIETTIWNITPNLDTLKIQTKSSDYVEEPIQYADEKQLYSDSTQNDAFRDTDDEVEKTGNNYDTQLSPSNSDSKSQQRSSQQAKDISLIKDNIVKTFEDFRQANGVMQEKFKSSLDNVLGMSSVHEISATDHNNVNLSLLEQKIRSNNDKETMKSFKSFEDLKLKSSEQKELSLNDSGPENEDKLLKLQEFKSKSEEDKNHDSEGNADGKSSDNLNRCLVYGTKERKNAYNDDNEMKMAASDSSNTRFGISQIPQNVLKNTQKNIIRMQTPANGLEDINLDIFRYQPISLDQDNRRNMQASLPRLNMKSYKTRLPIPKSVNLKPVKLQKAFRKGNDLLGAVLTIEPHAADINNKMKSSQRINNHNIDPALGMLPSFNELRSFLEHGAKNLVKIPHLSRNFGTQLASPFQNVEESAGNMRIYTEDALNNVQQSLSNILPNIHEEDRSTLGSSLINPNGLVESLSRNGLKMNEKIHDINERLKSIFGQSRVSYIQPIHHIYQIRPKTIKTERKQLTSAQRSPSRLLSNRDSSILHRNLIPKGSISTLKLSDDKRMKLPLSKIDKLLSENDWLSKTLISRPILQKNVNENKSVISLTTQKKSTNLDAIKNKNAALPTSANPLDNPRGFRNLLTQNLKSQLSKEQAFSPSENIFTKETIEDTLRQNPVAENEDVQLLKRIGQRSERPSQSLSKKLLLPNIAESSFLSKVKEALNKDTVRSADNENRTDVMSSASSKTMSAELPIKRMTFDCKMVCNSPIQ